MSSRFKEKNDYKNSEGREDGSPHPESNRNFQRWRDIWEVNDHFKKKIFTLKCTVVEFFRENGKEIVNKIYYPEFKTAFGDSFPNFCDENNFLRARPRAIPICLQISFHENGKHNCASINFHQNFEEFKKDVSWYLKCDVTY